MRYESFNSNMLVLKDHPLFPLTDINVSITIFISGSMQELSRHLATAYLSFLYVICFVSLNPYSSVSLRATLWCGTLYGYGPHDSSYAKEKKIRHYIMQFETIYTYLSLLYKQC